MLPASPPAVRRLRACLSHFVEAQGARAQQDAMEGRMAIFVAQYCSQGVHRTGTQVDSASSTWLAHKVR